MEDFCNGMEDGKKRFLFHSMPCPQQRKVNVKSTNAMFEKAIPRKKDEM